MRYNLAPIYGDPGEPLVRIRVLFCGQPVDCVWADADRGAVEVYVTDTGGNRIHYPDGSAATVELRGPVELVADGAP